MILVASVSALAVVAIIVVVLVIFLYPFEVDPAIFAPTRTCRGDGFSILYYNHTNKVTEGILGTFYKSTLQRVKLILLLERKASDYCNY